jgi:hypothetical protein
MSVPYAWPQVLDFFGIPLVIEPSPGQLSSDAWLLPVRQFDERIELTRDFAAALDDRRDPDLTEHTFLEMVRSRVDGIPSGYKDQNDADNDQFVMLSLRPGDVHAALGADDDGAYLVTRLRQAWPDVALHFRIDCGIGVPAMYDGCERLRVSYTLSLSANAVLQRETEGLLAEAVMACQVERQAAPQQEPARPAVPSRVFTGFWHQAGTWPCARCVVAQAEANDRGTNRRFVVTNRPGAGLLPGPTYDEYAGRGESENRNMEIKCDLAMDRLSDHRRANSASIAGRT